MVSLVNNTATAVAIIHRCFGSLSTDYSSGNAIKHCSSKSDPIFIILGDYYGIILYYLSASSAST